PPGGEVRVAMRRQRSEEEGERIEISVEDDGPGIPPHALERIFERFYTDRPEQGFGQNSGLGLSISRQIIEAHGGRIWAENRFAPNASPSADEADRSARHSAGARFILSLPAAP
ncbi:MAG TPA: ATP-binding protein, partial [Roseiarcus sp.]|nr:ATP-binding protein [Roseiarcus sp.]